MVKTSKEYSIFLHERQGDDFRHFLDENNGNVAFALRDWAAMHKANSDICTRLAQSFDGKAVEAYADHHHISFEPTDEHAVGLLDMLAMENLVDVYEFEDEDLYLGDLASDDEDQLI